MRMPCRDRHGTPRTETPAVRLRVLPRVTASSVRGDVGTAHIKKGRKSKEEVRTGSRTLMRQELINNSTHRSVKPAT